MDIYLKLFTDIIDSLERGIFPDELKLAEVIPLFKRAGPLKLNHIPVSLHSHILKVFEKNNLQSI